MYVIPMASTFTTSVMPSQPGGCNSYDAPRGAPSFAVSALVGHEMQSTQQVVGWQKEPCLLMGIKEVPS